MRCVATKTNTIIVNSVPFIPRVIKFTASSIVTFTDQSTGNPGFLNYDFGDEINANGKHPVYIYRFHGT